ncbi:MAG: sigma 54-interacting transcriptional regulator [candidate division WOR-3 bacterium]|nr:MAG: sigma 54-interacting transcriptional regulator [candidate division WOR-3 bacterium]
MDKCTDRGTTDAFDALLSKKAQTTEDFMVMFELAADVARTDAAEARRRLEAVAGAAEANRHVAALCLAHQRLAELLRDHGDHQASLAHAELVLRYAREGGEERFVASHHFLVGRVQECRGEYGMARDCYEHCLDIYRKLNMATGVRASLNQLVGVSLLQGRPEAALALCRQCLELCDGSVTDKNKATYYLNEGQVLRALGRWEDAVASFYRALTIVERDGGSKTTVWGNVLDCIGELFLMRGKTVRAIETFEQVIEAAENSESLRTGILTDVLAHVGEAYLRKGDLAGAEKALVSGIELADQLADKRSRILLLRRQAELALAKGDLEDGEAKASEAVETAEKLGLGIELCDVWRVRALVFAAQGDTHAANDGFERAVNALQARPASYDYALARFHYGRFLLDRGKRDAAIELLEAAAASFSALSIVPESEEIGRLLMNVQPAAGRQLALLRALTELNLMELEPIELTKQALGMLCNGMEFESGAVLADDTVLARFGPPGPDQVSGPDTPAGWVSVSIGTRDAPLGRILLGDCREEVPEWSRLAAEAAAGMLAPVLQRLAAAAEGVAAVPGELAGLRFPGVAGQSPLMLDVLRTVRRVAGTGMPVLIRGESGTGKELVARALHDSGPRSRRPFCAINCAAIPEALLEAELFGVEKGVATGVAARKGKLELSDGGTVFLDEIGDMSPGLQAKLLRVIQEQQFERVGGRAPVEIDVRVVAATNRDIAELLAEGRFRKDLYYRLNAVELVLPPLRERREDIPVLVDHFMARSNQEFDRKVKTVRPEVMGILASYSWPGNIRELQHVIERAVVLADRACIERQHLPPAVAAIEPKMIPRHGLRGRRDLAKETAVIRVERGALLECLEAAQWNVAKAAKAAGYSRAQFYRLMKKHGINRRKSRMTGEHG